ncbi:MAG: large subunit ribosomal protein L17 [Microgenomates group bacterium Gr01-1014_7]|nr:MAG: large subunit ribosomal protein L17 [Microgenomates group bacterium Gr01-1014_7]
MRHRLYGYKLGRNKDQRDVLFKNLVQSLFTHGSIQTSETKAKAIKGLVDKIINLAKSKTSRRLLQSYLVNEQLRDRLIKEILPKMENRVSGYTSLIKLGRRMGDNTMVVKMSLIGAEQLKPLEKVTSKK